MLLLPGNGVEADLGGGCGGGRIKRKRGERRGRGEARSNTITSVEPGADGRQPVVAFFHNSPLTNNYSFIPQSPNHPFDSEDPPTNQSELSSGRHQFNSIQFIPCCCNQSHFSSWKLLAANHSKFHYRIYNTTPTKLIIFILRRRRRRKNKKQRERDEQRLVR